MIFDPETNLLGEGPQLTTPRAQHKATPLQDGLILITGGSDGTNDLSSAEIISETGTTATTGMSVARREHCSVLLGDGRVFIAGGVGGTDYHASTEIFDPTTRKFALGPDMSTARAFHTCSLLPDGFVLILGGTDGKGKYPTAAERYVPSKYQGR